MTDSERLKDIVEQTLSECLKIMEENKLMIASSEFITAKMIECGVIAPPCKIGDPIYEVIFCRKNKASHILEEKVVGIHIIDAPQDLGHNRKNYIITHNKNTNQIRHIGFDKIGKSVFFSKADANKLLEEERNGES